MSKFQLKTWNFGIKFRIDVTESSDAKTFIVFLTTYQPKMKYINIQLPNSIADKRLKEMFISLCILTKKVC